MSEVYRKVRVLQDEGVGGIATVHEGWDEHLNRPVAIQELLPSLASDRELAGQFLDGARRMAEISHPHVLAVYQVDQSHASPWLILELADGGTLQQAAQAGPFPPAKAAGLLREMLLGLGELHRRGIVHRHIQPDNVFLCHGVWKLGGLGLPRTVGDVSPDTFASQLSKYRSPEELGQMNDPAPASDLYSLGLMVYELLVGEERLRREAETLVGREAAAGRLWLDFHLSPGELPRADTLVSRVPPGLAAVLQRMMRKDPAARYAGSAEVLADLERAESKAAPPPPAIEKTELLSAPGSPRGGRMKIAAVALGVLLVAVAGAVFLRPEKPVAVSSPVATPKPTPTAEPVLADAPALAAALAALTTSGDGLEIGGPAASVPVGSPMAFRVRSDRPAHGVLFVLSPDGAIYCLYPNPSRPALEIAPGIDLELPGAEDRADGFDLVAGEPPGRHVAYLLTADEPLPDLPHGEVLNPWMALHPLRPGPRNPAAGFVRWVGELRRDHPESTRLAALEVDVTRHTP